jgi:hypothetical protein
MSGVKGRSGRKPLPVALHLARGTYRRDRHGPKPVTTAGALALQPAVDVPPMPKAVLAGLGERGRALVADLWCRWEDWQPETLVLLHEAGTVADTLAAYAGIISHDGTTVTTARGTIVPHPLLRLQAQAQRTFVLLLAALDLRED